MEKNDFQPDEEPSGDGKTWKRQNFAPSNGGRGLHLLFEVVMMELIADTQKIQWIKEKKDAKSLYLKFLSPFQDNNWVYMRLIGMIICVFFHDVLADRRFEVLMGYMGQVSWNGH